MVLKVGSGAWFDWGPRRLRTPGLGASFQKTPLTCLMGKLFLGLGYLKKKIRVWGKDEIRGNPWTFPGGNKRGRCGPWSDVKKKGWCPPARGLVSFFPGGWPGGLG